jgi:hypothetical protein
MAFLFLFSFMMNATQQESQMSTPVSPTQAASNMCKLHEVTAPFSETVILVCEKCGAKTCKDPSIENPSRKLQQSLKEEIKRRNENTKQRAVLSSCLNICPEEAISLAILQLGRERSSSFFTINVHDSSQATEEILARLENQK